MNMNSTQLPWSATLIVLLASASTSLAYSSGDVSVSRFMAVTNVAPGAAVQVQVRVKNSGASDLGDFFYTDYLPAGLAVRTVSVRVGATTVTDYLTESATADSVYTGLVPYRWVFGVPSASSPKHPIASEITAEIVYEITAAQPGAFSLPEFTWAGQVGLGPEVAFGHSEAAEVLSLVVEAPNPDGDGDGLPDAWEEASGLSGSDNSGDNGSGGDPDGDGLSNLEEFNAGTHPKDAGSVLRFDAVAAAGTAEVMLQFTARSNRTYTVQWRSAVDAPWQKLQDIAGTGSERSVSVTNSVAVAGLKLYRVVTPQQP